MQESILENKPLINVLGFFLSSPERAFYVGNLQKRLGRSVDRHLSTLAKMDFLRTFTKKNLRYYILNRRNKQLPDIKNKILKTAKKVSEDELTKAMRQMPKIKVAVLCGLFAANPSFECDMLLVGEISKKRMENFLKLAEKLASQELNFALLSMQEYEFRRNMSDRFIKDIYENPHLVIVNKLK